MLLNNNPHSVRLAEHANNAQLYFEMASLGGVGSDISFNDAAYHYALVGNLNSLNYCCKMFIELNIVQAQKNANDKRYQKINPLYSAKLYDLIAQKIARQEYNVDAANAYNCAAYYYAIIRDLQNLNRCAEELVKTDIGKAIISSNNGKYQNENPLYCAKLYESIADKKTKKTSAARAYNCAAYCYALAREQQSLTICIRKLLDADIDEAQRNANNLDNHKRNPIYHQELSRALRHYSIIVPVVIPKTSVTTYADVPPVIFSTAAENDDSLVDEPTELRRTQSCDDIVFRSSRNIETEEPKANKRSRSSYS